MKLYGGKNAASVEWNAKNVRLLYDCVERWMKKEKKEEKQDGGVVGERKDGRGRGKGEDEATTATTDESEDAAEARPTYMHIWGWDFWGDRWTERSMLLNRCTDGRLDVRRKEMPEKEGVGKKTPLVVRREREKKSTKKLRAVGVGWRGHEHCCMTNWR